MVLVSHKGDKTNGKTCYSILWKFNKILSERNHIEFLYLYSMKTVTIQLPDNLDMPPKEIVTALAAQLYEMGKLSLGQAAELAGYSKRGFMEVLGSYGVSVFNFPADELDNDVKNAEGYHI